MLTSINKTLTEFIGMVMLPHIPLYCCRKICNTPDMTNINIPYYVEFKMNASNLVSFIFANDKMPICIFTPAIINEHGDPDEYIDAICAVYNIVEYWATSSFIVGIVTDCTTPYICITIVNTLTNS